MDPETGRFISEDPIKDELVRKLSDSYKTYLKKNQKENRSKEQKELSYFEYRLNDRELTDLIINDSSIIQSNGYLYCKNNPVWYIDQNGKSPFAPIMNFLLGFAFGQGLTPPDQGIQAAINNGLTAGLMFYGVGELYGAYRFNKMMNTPIQKNTGELNIQSVNHAVPSAGNGQSVLNGIDLRYVDPGNRFGRGFYVSQQAETTVNELAAHQKIATNIIRYDINLANQRVLNLANPEVAKEWGFTQNASVATCQQIAEKAQNLGFNVIAFPSYRGAGINLVVYDNFDQILKPVMVTPATP